MTGWGRRVEVVKHILGGLQVLLWWLLLLLLLHLGKEVRGLIMLVMMLLHLKVLRLHLQLHLLAVLGFNEGGRRGCSGVQSRGCWHGEGIVIRLLDVHGVASGGDDRKEGLEGERGSSQQVERVGLEALLLWREVLKRQRPEVKRKGAERERREQDRIEGRGWGDLKKKKGKVRKRKEKRKKEKKKK